MEKQELLEQELYYLTVAGQTPLMMNNELILLYADIAKADAAKAKFTERFACQIEKTEITDNVEFIKDMYDFTDIIDSTSSIAILTKKPNVVGKTIK